MKDHISLFKLVISHVTTYKTTSSSNFMYELKDNILDNFIKYKGLIDKFNFNEVYEEVDIHSYPC